MSRITGNEVQGLMEAYNEVYAPQELTEEQVWEEVENWVYSLVEEGYDLSDYTWEDMYEEYLNEMGQPGGNVPGGTRPISNAPYRSRFARPMNAGTPRQTGRGTAITKPQIASLPPSAKQVTQYPSGVPTGAGGGNAGSSRPSVPPTRRSPVPPTSSRTQVPPVARPAATTPAPSKPKPSTPSAPPSPTSGPSAPPPPTAKRPSLASQADELRQMRAASQQRQAAMLKQSFDLYDIIKGHLLDEGYADTEEAAEAIMVSMSEEWRTEILDEAYRKPKFNRTHYLKKLSKRGGMGMGTPEDPHGYRDPKMAKVGSEFSKRITAAAKAEKTGEPDKYRAEKEAQSKYKG